MERKVWALFLNVQNKIIFTEVYLIAVENVAGELFAFSWSIMVVLHLYLGSERNSFQAPWQLFQSKAGQWSFSFLAKNGVSRPSPPTAFPFLPKSLTNTWAEAGEFSPEKWMTLPYHKRKLPQNKQN